MKQRMLILLSVWFLIDLYFFQALRTASADLSSVSRDSLYSLYWLSDGLILSIILYFSLRGGLREGLTRHISWLMGFMILSLVPKLVVLPVLFMEDIGRLFVSGYGWIRGMTDTPEHMQGAAFFIARKKLVSELTLAIAALPFAAIIFGMIRGKYHYRVHRVTLHFKDLPEAFDGFTITQLSDIHAGSFDRATAVEQGIELINEQGSDLLVFTGDMVNNKAEEMEPWKEIFSRLEAPYGKYSVLGNHDYGDYVPWPSREAKQDNLRRLKEIQAEMGFRLLLNEQVEIEKDGQHISLAGSENWGLRGFHQYGDLNKAVAGLDRNRFKILLSHDPSHWEAEARLHPKHIHLALAGHTHGMQFGIEIPGFKWSPVKYVYPEWAGIYGGNGQHLYVNRGFGFLGFPGRVGIRPEITVITLKKG
jgi:predicted MPP superfamily phosphohydrolase